MGEIYGRETELERVSAVSGHALVLSGEPGIGKTTLWEAGIAAARERGVRVLVARPSGAETELSFAGLIDLCEGLEVDMLPEPQRDALEVALLRRSPVGVPPEPHAIGLGLRNALAAGAPALVAIDDLQWLDGPSAEALAFAARRLDDARVGFLLARRPGEPSAVERALERRSLERLAVGPLSPWAIRELLRETPAEVARRIAEATLGNPFFALEVARALPAAGAELPVPAAVEDLLGTRVAALPAELRRLLLAVALSADLHVDELEAIAGGEIDAALAAGILRIDGERVRAAHPLLAAAARTAARPGERRDLHAALADTVREPEQRALHFALATPKPDEALATRLSTAAARAAARGARPEAVALAEQALRLTPPTPADLLRPQGVAVGAAPARSPGAGPARSPGAALGAAPARPPGAALGAAPARPPGAAPARPLSDAAAPSPEAARVDARPTGPAAPVPAAPLDAAVALAPSAGDARAERLLALATYLEISGERQRLADLLLPEVESLPPGAPRVRAWLLLSDAGIHAREEYTQRVERALDEAGDDPELRARVLAAHAVSTAAEAVERITDAEAWALEALPAGEDALRALAWARVLRGSPLDEVIERFRDVAGPAAQLVNAPEALDALRRSWRGEIGPARAATSGFLALADERGEGVGYAWLRLNLTELELRAGDWAAAERLLDEWADSDDGQFLITPTYQRCRALLAVGRGDAEAAERWGAPALAEAEARDYRWQVLESSRALGAAALLAGDPPRALEHLRSVWAYCEREGVDEPGAFPVAPDLVEALIEVGADEEALAVTRRLAELAEAQEHPWARLTALRCTGSFAEAAAGYERLGLRFDAARCRLALGRAERRRRQWRAAREALQDAAARFDALGSPGWADLARAELARVGGRKPRADGQLTETEEQVARLAAEGHTNKEIALVLFVTVHTVEAHLSSTYAKLGVRSRAHLAKRLKIGDPGNFAET